jgi:hypothetical protein
MIRRALLSAIVLSSVLGTSVFAQETGKPAPGIDARLETLRERLDQADLEEEQKRIAAEGLRIARLSGRDVDREQEMVHILAESARKSLELGMPFPFPFDAEGRMTSSQVTSEFESWAAASGLALGEALRLAMYDQPTEIANLYGSSDSMAIAAFQDALTAENYFVAISGATALALIDHAESAPEVISLSYAVPFDVAEVLAYSLERFSDPAAQARAEEIRTTP